MSSPRVTVLLPVRDGEPFIEDALRSLTGQTLDRFRVLVLDDGSSDGTADRVGRFCRDDSRVELVRGEHVGIAGTLARGLELVETEFTARMDADDVSRPERLASQLAFLDAAPELSGCGTGVLAAGRAPTPRSEEYRLWLNSMTSWEKVERDLFVECPLAHPTFFFRTDALRKVGGYRDRGWPEDYDLLLRLWRAGYRFVSLPESLLEWRDGEDRLSRTHPSYSLEAFRRCRIHHLGRSHLLGERPVVIWGAGPTGKALARTCLEEGVDVVLFAEVDPRKIGQEINRIPVGTAEEAVRVRDALHMGAVARREGRMSVREMARSKGLIEGRNFLSVA